MNYNLNTDILLSVEYLKFLLKSGYSVKDAVKIISNRKLGAVSDLFDSSLKKMESGKTLNEALAEQASALSGNLKELFLSLSSTMPVESLDSLEKKAMDTRTNTIENLSKKAGNQIGKIALVLLIPMFYYFFVALKTIFESIGWNVAVPPNAELVVLGAVVALLVVIIYLMRYKENG